MAWNAPVREWRNDGCLAIGERTIYFRVPGRNSENLFSISFTHGRAIIIITVTLNLLIVVWITSNVHFDNRPDQYYSLHINYRRLKYAQSATYHAEYLHVQVLINYANKYRHNHHHDYNYYDYHYCYYFDWKRSSRWLESLLEGLLFATDVSTTCAEAIFRVKMMVFFQSRYVTHGFKPLS